MRIGYAFWGFLSDYKLDADGDEISRPDGNAFYSWSIIWELQRRGHEVVALMPDRDAPAVRKYGEMAFNSFSSDKRNSAYTNLIKYDPEVTEYLDAVLLEWRWPTDRNHGLFGRKYEDPDLDIQNKILERYTGNTPIYVMDLDHKLTEFDEGTWQFTKVIETSFQPKKQVVERTSVGIPFVMEDMKQFKMKDGNSEHSLVYVGSRYERDDSIEKYIAPLQMADIAVHFYGNWLEERYNSCIEMWPGIEFHSRITHREFRQAYENAKVCPLMAKESYYKTGFHSARILEALLFGAIPLGFEEHVGIHRLLPDYLIVRNAAQIEELFYDSFGSISKERMRTEILDKCSDWFDVRRFVDNVFGKI